MNPLLRSPSRSPLRPTRRAVLVLPAAAALACRALRPAPRRLRVTAYNIKHGLGMDGRVDLERIAAVLAATRPDVVTLQEVDERCRRSGSVDQARRLGELLGMDARFGPFMDYDGGRYGMALLSRLPILGSANLPLPPGPEPRTALAATVALAGLEVVVVGIHFYRSEAERTAQAAALLEHLAGEARPTVLAGDFNTEPGGEPLALLERTFRAIPKDADRLTFPSDAPEIEIDHVLVRPPERFGPATVDVLDEPVASDHRPLVCELPITAGEPDRA